MKAVAEELNGRRRPMDVPVDERGNPDRRVVEKHGDGMHVYEYACDDEDGLRVYRHMSTERL